MNVGNVNGPDGVPRGAPRPDARPGRGPARRDGVSDSAHISALGAESLAAFESLVERARADDPDRGARVAEVRARLERGELDGQELFRRVAARMIEDGV